VMGVRKIGTMAVQCDMQLARMGGFQFRTQFTENTLDVLWRDIVIDRMRKQRVQDFPVMVVHKGLG
jgi:hypothetical protein